MMTDEIKLLINIIDIMKYMPHRYPFLLVDRVLEVEPNKSIKVLKNVTINEPFFTGHFPDYPVMPGVLIIEAMAQACGILTVVSFGERTKNVLYFLAAIDNVKFKKQVIPGDTLIFEALLKKFARGVGIYSVTATVNGVIATVAEITIIKKEV